MSERTRVSREEGLPSYDDDERNERSRRRDASFERPLARAPHLEKLHQIRVERLLARAHKVGRRVGVVELVPTLAHDLGAGETGVFVDVVVDMIQLCDI